MQLKVRVFILLLLLNTHITFRIVLYNNSWLTTPTSQIYSSHLLSFIAINTILFSATQHLYPQVTLKNKN